MSNVAIQAALEAWLKAMPNTLPESATQYENDEIKTAVEGQPFQRVFLLPGPHGPANNPTMGSRRFTRYRGVFQVTLEYPRLQGSGYAREQAERIEARFWRGLSVSANGVTTHIDYTPSSTQGREDGDKWVVVVSVIYHADVFSS